MRILKAMVVAAAVFTPYQASALVMTGMFNATPAPLAVGGSTQGSVIANAFENYGSVLGSFTTGARLRANISSTINPYLTAIAGGGLSNSIVLDYQINGGSLVSIPITKTNNTGSGFIAPLVLQAGDLVTFQVSGVAGRSGNDVTFNVDTTAVPIPPALGFLGAGIVGLGFMSQRTRKNSARS